MIPFIGTLAVRRKQVSTVLVYSRADSWEELRSLGLGAERSVGTGRVDTRVIREPTAVGPLVQFGLVYEKKQIVELVKGGGITDCSRFYFLGLLYVTVSLCFT